VEKISVLIPDGESFTSLNVVRSLAHSKELDVHVLSAGQKLSGIQRSRHCKFYKLRSLKSDDDARLEKIFQISRRVHIEVLLPISEEGVSFVASNQRFLNKLFQIPPIPDPKSLEIVRDKWLLNEFAHQRDLPTPKSILFQNHTGIDSLLSTFSYPVLLKPRIGRSGYGIQRFDTAIELLNMLEQKSEALLKNGYLIQEFISGSDVDLSVLCQYGKILAYTIQRPVIKAATSFSYGRVVELIKHGEVFEIGRRLLSALNWNGVAHIDFIRHEKNGRIFILDFNPRYWGTLLGSTVSGVNFPYLACLAARGVSFPIPYYRNIVFAVLGRKEILPWIFGRKHFRGISLGHTNLRFALLDPFPSIGRF
jgi:predicted ATP-grasp superfamily ATP-dependent carboligase